MRVSLGGRVCQNVSRRERIMERKGDIKEKKLIVGISGATGAIYGIRLLEVLKEMGVETHLVITKPAERTILYETDYTVDEVIALATYHYDIDNTGGAIASGSFVVDGMVVIPCSIKTLSAIAHSYNENLLVRAADVTLKERRKLVLVVRETPLHRGHLELMSKVVDLGALILPPVTAFYTLPKSLDDVINHTVGKVLTFLGIPHSLFRAWDRRQGEVIKELGR